MGGEVGTWARHRGEREGEGDEKDLRKRKEKYISRRNAGGVGG